MNNKKYKKVLIVGSDLSVKGGITSVINSFLEHNWKDIDIELLPTYIDGNAINKISFFSKAILIYLIKLLKNNFDIAHIHMSYRGSFYRKLLIVKLSNIFKKRVILHLHGSEFEVFYNNSNWLVKRLIKNILESSTEVIVLGQKWNSVIKNISSKSNVKVFNNAVKIPNYEVDWNEEKINILFLGVLIKRKGIYELIDAIKILDDANIVKEKNITFTIGGTGKEENSIKQLISKYELEHCIDMVGWIDGRKKEELFKESQVFILPSYNEGLPMAILEAMSYGIPVISTNVGSISEVVKDNKTGYLLHSTDINQIKDAIQELSEDKIKWQIYSKNCRSLIYNKFNQDIYFKKFYDLYMRDEVDFYDN